MNTPTESLATPAIKEMLLAKMGELAAEYPTHLEAKFPRILARVADYWGTAKLDSYLDQLMLPDREGRQGFPAEVATEIFHLSHLHSALGLSPKTTGYGWSSAEEVDHESKAIGKRT